MKLALKKQQEIASAAVGKIELAPLAALDRACRDSVNLLRKPLPAFRAGDREFQIARYLFVGPKGGAEPIRVGLFAGLHGDEPEGTLALSEFALALERNSDLARNYFLFLYPLLNPAGFEARSRLTADGVNIAHELWKNSSSAEVQQIQSELWMHAFDGIVSLRTDARASEILIEVGGPIFARHLFGNSLANAQDILPQAVDSRPETLPRFKGSLLEKPNELIRAAPGVKPRPFEIVITIPGKAPGLQQRTAVALLLQRALADYRNFIAYGANI
jgi:murein peptide amidase A